MTLALREPAIHPEGNAIFGYDGGNHFARNGKARPRGVFAASDKSLPRSRNNDAGLREPAIHPKGNAIHGLVEGTISSEMERSVRRVSFAASAPSGQTSLSPDETQFRCFPSGQMAFSPDERAL